MANGSGAVRYAMSRQWDSGGRRKVVGEGGSGDHDRIGEEREGGWGDRVMIVGVVTDYYFAFVTVASLLWRGWRKGAE